MNNTTSFIDQGTGDLVGVEVCTAGVEGCANGFGEG